MLLSDIFNHDFSHVHFIGIGGISMSGLAEILLNEGYRVTGSDMKDSPIISKLRKKGATVFIGHDDNNLSDADLVVYTDAISDDNPEFIEANKRGITVIDRGSFLGQLMRTYENSIAVSGTHGKTTTTGMISIILDKSTLDPTILLGGELDQIGGNVRLGKDSYLLAEACEYKGNILKFFPSIGIILNIEEDHLDFFKDLNHIIETFTSFAESIPKSGYLVLNNDDVNVAHIKDSANCNIVTFGIENDSTYQAKNIEFDDNGMPKFSLVIDGNSYEANLSVMGIHNIYNSLAAIASTHICGVPLETIINSIQLYTGTHRRLEHKGSYNGIGIIDDYAHHPTAVKATLSSIQKIAKNDVWCVFQPHTYTRTNALLDEFTESFDNANKVIISDIYAAREKDTGLVHSKDLVNNLKERNVDAVYIKDFEDIAGYLLDNCKEGDIVLTMGAGDIYTVGEILLDKVK
ncbi:UDP-N-acetylmuramate--L-alanine ligase [Sporosalibacterium faouarense]|uniref:UDP-N-acetylmuramate--L-alanine ligase n=1 Tax=Sporosalibacterium faouarense TaxID=516123 RepID=UPI00192C68C9|nr:UDP-N-acetylmuramate--L-alanine ligase [Sporosalibacterium faouarense]